MIPRQSSRERERKERERGSKDRESIKTDTAQKAKSMELKLDGYKQEGQWNRDSSACVCVYLFE